LNIVLFLSKCIILVFLGVLTTGIQNSYILEAEPSPESRQ